MTVDVAMCWWPRQAEKGEYRIKNHNPVMWVVETGSAPPECLDPLEDWIRPPVNQAELKVRVSCLIERAKLSRIPILSMDNVLRYRGHKLPMAASEAVLMRELVDNFGNLVPRSKLMQLGWGTQSAKNRNALDLRILRLRHRLRYVALRVVTAWGKGYMLEAEEEKDQM